MMSHLVRTLQHINTSLNGWAQGSVLGSLCIGAFTAAVGFLTPIKSLLLICFATTVVDMIFGIRVARKFKKKIESGKNWKGTLRKIIDEFTIIALAHGIEWSILDETGVFLLTGGVTAIVTLTELWSIIENLNTIDPNGPWKILGAFLKKKGEDYTGIELNFDKDEHTDDSKSTKEQTICDAMCDADSFFS